MGQRLVITVKDENKELAKAYYHWSGYTASGLAVTSTAIQHLEYAAKNAISSMSIQRITDKTLTDDDIKNRTSLLIACNMLFSTNAGMEVYSKEDEAFKALFPECNYMTGINRSDGLVAITDKGMENIQKYSEADVIIDIDNKTADVSNLFMSCDPEEDDDNNVMDLVGNLCEMPFEDLPQFANTVINAISNRIYTFKNNDEILWAIA